MTRTVSAFVLFVLFVFSAAARGQQEAAYTYAITGARIVPVSAAPIDIGTIVFTDGVITAVGANVTVPAGAITVQGKGLTVYPGLIDMGSTAGLEPPPIPRSENPQTTEDVEPFESNGLSEPKDFLKNAQKTVASGLSKDSALKALTLNAATLAGAADRLGSLDRGKIANLVVTDGDLFDEKSSIKHVFVNGRPVKLN